MGRRLAQIDHHIEDRAIRNAYQLALRGRILEMKPAQDAFLRTAMIVLYKAQVQALLSKSSRVPALHEETALVTEYIRFDHKRSGYRALNNLHDITGLSSNCSRYSP